MSKRAKSVIRLFLKATTVRRLGSPEFSERAACLFEDVSPRLLPTDIVSHEGRGGRRAFSREALTSHSAWAPQSTDSIALRSRGILRGRLSITPNWGHPRRWGRQPADDFTPPLGGNEILASFDVVPLMKAGLFNDALRLFQNMVTFADACHAAAWITTESTARYIDFDNPLFAQPYAIEWNGVLIDPALRTHEGGRAVHCLPRFDTWINVLGPEYVRLLGREKLMALDVCTKHEDGEGRVWLQITESPEQMYLPEVREHVRNLMGSLDAEDVFCRRPGTEATHQEQPDEYRRPDFDLSGIHNARLDPFSPERARVGFNLGRRTVWLSEGYLAQIAHRHKTDLDAVVQALVAEALRARGYIEPFAVALAQDDELLSVRIRDAGQWKLQKQADLVVERLARLCEDRAIKAVGACFCGKGLVPGQPEERTAFKFHVESAEGDAYAVYLPFNEVGRKREYGTLVIEPGELTVFAPPGPTQ